MNLFSLFGKKRPRVRIAPSPTGNLHIGTARTALYNFLYAKHTGGTFIVRIEDTDRERSRPEFEKNILDGLSWLGMYWDEFYKQSERLPVYQKALAKLIEKGRAYVSKEPSKTDPKRKVEVVRLKNPGRSVTFFDEIRGEITTDTTDLGDFVIARSIKDPLYHLAVVVDDGETGITHVIRGEDHISNTPRQILIMEALGYPRPRYAHLSLILAPDRSKMSKRHGATAIDDYREAGFIPEAIVNYLALLGWNPGTTQELFSGEELVRQFELGKLNKSGAVFDMNRFLWFNREHLKRLPPELFMERLGAYTGDTVSVDGRAIPLIQERVVTLKEAKDVANSNEFAYLSTLPLIDPALLIPKRGETSGSASATREHLTRVGELLLLVSPSQWSEEDVKSAVWKYAEEKGRGAVLWPTRVALSGLEKSPNPFLIASLLGKDETLRRITRAAELLV